MFNECLPICANPRVTIVSFICNGDTNLGYTICPVFIPSNT